MSSASAAVCVRPTTSSTDNGVSSSGDSPIVVVMLLQGGSDAPDNACDSSLLTSLKSVGPAIFPPRNSNTAFPLTIRCIASSPPVCIVHVHSNNAVAAAASMLPDLVVALPCCFVSRSEQQSAVFISQLQLALPTVPIVSSMDAPKEAAALCALLRADGDVDWMQVADAAFASAKSIRYQPTHFCAAIARQNLIAVRSTAPPVAARRSTRLVWAAALAGAAAVAAGVFVWLRSSGAAASAESAAGRNVSAVAMLSSGAAIEAQSSAVKAIRRW